MATQCIQPYTPDQSTMKETRVFHPRDLDLRRLGWRIYSRPKEGEPSWERNGRVVKQSQAVKEMDQKKSCYVPAKP